MPFQEINLLLLYTSFEADFLLVPQIWESFMIMSIAK